MKNIKSLFVFGLLLITGGLFAHTASAQRVYGFITKDSLHVGDKLNYTLVVKRNKKYDDIIYPDSTQFGHWFQVEKVKHYNKTAYSDSLVYSLQFFGVKDTLLPSLKIAFISGNDTTYKKTSPIPISFVSEVKNKKTAKFKPLKPIFEFALSILPYIIIFIVLLIAGWFAYRWYKKKQMEEKPVEAPKPEPKVFIDPLDILEKKLFSLRSDDSLTNRDFKTFYSKLSDTLREYYENVYNITALELTTRELIRELDTIAVDRELFNQTNKILRQADMVKFAKFTPTLDQAYDDLKTGEYFLTRAREVDRGRISYLKQRFEEDNKPEEPVSELDKEEETDEDENVNQDKTT